MARGLSQPTGARLPRLRRAAAEGGPFQRFRSRDNHSRHRIVNRRMTAARALVAVCTVNAQSGPAAKTLLAGAESGSSLITPALCGTPRLANEVLTNSEVNIPHVGPEPTSTPRTMAEGAGAHDDKTYLLSAQSKRISGAAASPSIGLYSLSPHGPFS